MEFYDAGRISDWFTVRDGVCNIDKEKLLHRYRTALTALAEATPKQYRWDKDKMSYGLYVEKPLNLKNIRDSLQKSHDDMVHCHIVVCY